MKIHELKTDLDVFRQVQKGWKTFEIRKNDRDFKLRDILHLRATSYSGEEMKRGKPLEYTGEELLCEVIGILHGPLYGLIDGWVIMYIKLLKS